MCVFANGAATGRFIPAVVEAVRSGRNETNVQGNTRAAKPVAMHGKAISTGGCDSRYEAAFYGSAACRQSPHTGRTW